MSVWVATYGGVEEGGLLGVFSNRAAAVACVEHAVTDDFWEGRGETVTLNVAQRYRVTVPHKWWDAYEVDALEHFTVPTE